MLEQELGGGEQMRNYAICTHRQRDISIKRDETGRAHSHMGDNKNVYNIFRKPERKKPL